MQLISAPPRSGLNLLTHCLTITGFKCLDRSSQVTAEAIDNLLLQDLGLSPLAPGALPSGWMETQATAKAKERINKLLDSQLSGESSTSEYPSSLITACPVKQRGTSYRRGFTRDTQITINSLTLPLWLEVLAEHGIDTKLIHIIRHPYEVALSLQANHGLDLTQGHILWLSHIRAAMRASGIAALPDNKYQITDNCLLTFDQLLADPVSAIYAVLGSSLTSDLGTRTSDLLDFVNPSQKHHHASDLPETEAETYKPYAKLYDQIRAQHTSKGINNENSLPAKRVEPSQAAISSMGKIRGDSHTPSNRHAESNPQGIQPGWETNSSDLIDTLLQTINQYEQAQIKKNTATVEDKSITAKILFSLSEEKQNSEEIHLISDQWQKISVSVPDFLDLSKDAIIISPLNKKGGAVKIANILLKSRITKEEIWSTSNDFNLEQINIFGSVLYSKNNRQLELIISGEDATILLPSITQVNTPIYLEFWIKPSFDKIAHFEKWLEHNIKREKKWRKKSNGPIHVCLTFDDNYAKHACALLKSIFKNNRNIIFYIHIFYTSLSNRNKYIISNYIEEEKHKSSFYYIEQSKLKSCPIKDADHVSISAYLRIFLPELLQSNINKVLYLDPDIIVCSTLEELWNINIENFSLAAVPGYADHQRKYMLGLEEDNLYFNSGVMLINLDYWRNKKLTKNILQYIESNAFKLKKWDQDALNACLKNSWKRLPLQYNAQRVVFSNAKNHPFMMQFSLNEYLIAKINPTIVHFTGVDRHKPWHPESISPNKFLYLEHANEYPCLKMQDDGE